MVASRVGVAPPIVVDVGIAVSLAVALSCRRVVCFSFVPRVVAAGAGFSYSLYLIHLPVAVFTGAALERMGWPTALGQPGFTTYSAFALTVAASILAAYLFSRATEARTGMLRHWILTTRALGVPAQAKHSRPIRQAKFARPLTSRASLVRLDIFGRERKPLSNSVNEATAVALPTVADTRVAPLFLHVRARKASNGKDNKS
jgi:hypothetical protein